MTIEHVAFQLPDPKAAAQWYGRHLGFTVKRSTDGPPFGFFLADAGGKVMLEFYRNAKAPIPDYRSMDPLLLHVAFQVGDVPEARGRLLAAGATAEGEVVTTPEGDQVAMLRDPWGFCVQLVRRAQPMV